MFRHPCEQDSAFAGEMDQTRLTEREGAPYECSSTRQSCTDKQQSHLDSFALGHTVTLSKLIKLDILKFFQPFSLVAHREDVHYIPLGLRIPQFGTLILST